VRAARERALGDTGLRAHALRLAVAVAASTLVYRAIGLPHGYWVALTTLAILQPGEHATRVRVLQRAVGTLGGAALIIVITLAIDERWLLVAGAAAAAFWRYALDDRGYFWLVVLLTPHRAVHAQRRRLPRRRHRAGTRRQRFGGDPHRAGLRRGRVAAVATPRVELGVVSRDIGSQLGIQS
jgi:hypothetical protein